MLNIAFETGACDQSHAANRVIQALRSMYIKTIAWTVVQIMGTFLPSLLSSCLHTLYQPQRTLIHKPYPTTYCPSHPKTRPTNLFVSLSSSKSTSTPVVGSFTCVDTKNGPSVNTYKALTGTWAKKQASVNAGVKTPPGSRCEFFSFTLCVLRKCDGGLKVLRRG